MAVGANVGDWGCQRTSRQLGSPRTAIKRQSGDSWRSVGVSYLLGEGGNLRLKHVDTGLLDSRITVPVRSRRIYDYLGTLGSKEKDQVDSSL
ncbi:hypothetical protein HNY73_020092 [Argiope bruennichi]|uniref:Uncharacterized protein n=1 Tax=Argiope bruennichi TaxID=94029 RepID=A0A8T0E6T3_ARGBR|nr:hypothetical protein HNY73_020092 [Argiope bruennichi]